MPKKTLLHNRCSTALHCIASLAGENTRQLVLNQLFTVDNAMALAYDTRSKFDECVFAIESGKVSTGKFSFQMCADITFGNDSTAGYLLLWGQVHCT